MLARARSAVLTLAAAGVGGSLFHALGLPAPWISGALVVVSVLALGGLKVAVPDPVRVAAFVLLGASMGTALTPDALAGAAHWPLTMLLLAVSVVLAMAGSIWFLMRVSGWDLETSFFAATPGALSTVMAMAADTRADLRRVAFGQSLRLFLLVAALPSVLGARMGPDAAGPALDDTASLLALAVLVAVSAVAGGLAVKARVPGGLMIGAMAGSALLHGADLSHAVLPPALLVPAYVVLGAGVGVRFLGTSLLQMRHFFVASLGAFVVALAVSVALALLAASASGYDPGMVVTAFAPGALEAMTSLGFAMGYDPAFLVAHHMFRFGALSLVLPVAGHLMFGRQTGDRAGDQDAP